MKKTACLAAMAVALGASAQLIPTNSPFTNWVTANYTITCFGGTLYSSNNFGTITNVSTNGNWTEFTNAQFRETELGCPNETNTMTITWTWGKELISTNFRVFTMGDAYYTWTPYRPVVPQDTIMVVYTDGFFGTVWPPPAPGTTDNHLQDAIYGWKNEVDYSDVVYYWPTNYLLITNAILRSMNFSADSQVLMRPHGYGLEYVYIFKTNAPKP